MAIKQYCLGLDIGATSIGWALLGVTPYAKNKGESTALDTEFNEGEIVACGVRLFTAGKEAFDSAKEKSLAEDRRKARGIRRRIRRIAERKAALKKILQQAGLWEFQPDTENIDPLMLRSLGLDQKLSLKEFGIAIYHLGQRRGFRSARKTDPKQKKSRNKTDDADHDEKSKSGGGEGKTEEKKEDILLQIKLLADEIKNTGKRTLGEYLYSLRANDEHTRIRNRYTRRDMYKEEFELLWEKQSQYHPGILTPELREKVENAIFFQRNIYWRQSTIGDCELVPGEQRCPRADRLAQEFRFLQEINNLKYVDPQTREEIRVADDSEALQKIIELGKKKKEVTFNEIRKLLGIKDSSIRFNLESGKKKKGKTSETEEDVFRSGLKGFETDTILRSEKYFGKNWDKIPEGEQNTIVRILLEKPANPAAEKMQFDNKGRAKQMTEEELRAYIVKHWKQWGLNDEQIDNLIDAEADLPKMYLSLSRKAIAKILPFMRQGLLFSGPMDRRGNYNDALHLAGFKRPDEANEWQVFDKLPSVELLKKLGKINNPVVRRIVNETRCLLNAIIATYGRPDRIHIELARKAKASSEERKRISSQNKTNKDERDGARKYLEECIEKGEGGIKKVTRDALLRYRLWNQQGKICPYTGKSIAFANLFSESEVDIDHILPLSRTLDDSQMNKVVCFTQANRDKSDQSPYEWLVADPKRYEDILERIAKYPYPKRQRFEQKEINTEEFTNRQLIDTQYASRYVAQYLQALYHPHEWKEYRRILTVKGGQTSDIRHFWGLNDILHNSDLITDDTLPGDKNRGDHRHHAIDALVVALTDTKQLALLGRYKECRSDKLKSLFPTGYPVPWAQFRGDAEHAINDIIVSHRPSGRVRGGLHNDTNYGPVWKDKREEKREEGKFVVRKELTALTPAELFKIRDERIKKLVFARLAKLGFHPVQKGKGEDSKTFKIEAKELKIAFAEPLYLTPEKEKNNGKPKHLSVIKKVRIVVEDQTIQQVKPNRKDAPFVKPGSNHHICLFEYTDEKGKKVREAIFTNRLEANRRLVNQQRLTKAKRKELQALGIAGEELKKQIRQYTSQVASQIEPIIRKTHPERPDAKFLFSLKRGEMFRVLDKGDEKLVVFKTAPSTSGQMTFLDIRDARKEPDKISKRGSSYFDILEKVQVNRIGMIVTAND